MKLPFDDDQILVRQGGRFVPAGSDVELFEVVPCGLHGLHVHGLHVGELHVAKLLRAVVGHHCNAVV